MDSPPAAAAGKRRASKRKASGDTIEVKQKSASATGIEKMSPYGTRNARSTKVNVVTGVSNRPWGRKGKAPVHEVMQETVDDEADHVSEYELSDYDPAVDEEEDDDEDAMSIITVSSETSMRSGAAISDRPWKDFTLQTREQWEIMYASLNFHHFYGDQDWEGTEEYQQEKDAEMLRYMEDFPLQKWIIPQDTANQAYYRLLERTRWRSFGIPIYGNRNGNRDVKSSIANGNTPRVQQAPGVPQDVRPQSNGPHPPVQQYASAGVPPSHQGLMNREQGPGMLPPGYHHTAHAGPGHGGHQMPPHGQHLLPQYPNALQSQQLHLTSRPVGPPQQMGYGAPPVYPSHLMLPAHFHPSEGKSRRPRERKESPVAMSPPPPPQTPPYKLRQKPVDKKSIKVPKRSSRRPAEAEEFPWTRILDFRKEKANAIWDDSVYNLDTLREMDAIRARNVAIIDDLDAKVQDQQRLARQAKKTREKDGGPAGQSSDVEGESKEKKKMQRGQRKGESGGDPYHSGAFAFATDEDEERAVALGYRTPDDCLEAGGFGRLPADAQATIGICWNPGKKGMTENLEQVRFSVRDTIVTRKQVERTTILTRRAAECIIDFSPDMLWRGMLLRITSEAGFGNKDVRDRFCHNGCYCDKATITKRISAALGQKQMQPKSKGYGHGEYEWYEENVKDFTKYIEYFGKRSSHRNMLKIQMQGEKRRARLSQIDAANGGMTAGSSDAETSAPPPPVNDAAAAAAEKSGNKLQLQLQQQQQQMGKATSSSEAATTVQGSDEDVEMEEADADEAHDSDASDDSNAVSVQDSDILDRMEED